MLIKLGGETLSPEYVDASLDASSDIYALLKDFYNMYDGCAFE